MKKLIAFVLLISAFELNAQTDSIALISYLDGIIESRLKDRGIAGATMALVKDGQIYSLQGYGYSDVNNRKKTDPNRTLFRIGSISKTFIWTALMQLKAEGKLSLEEPVKTYLPELGSKLDGGEKAVRVIDLMNHTPGLEDRIIGLFSKDAEDIKPLEQLLEVDPPERVRDPDTYASYSNYGAGVACRIVEAVSGMDWNDYVETKILQPAGMERTTFRQPLPQNLAGDMSKGYTNEAGQLVEQYFEYVPMTGIGGASSTAADMARYMMMHLQLGTIDSVSVLDSATAQQMQSPSFRHHPAVNPMRHGFIDFSQNGITIFGHGGDTFWFHSIMALYPEQNMGLFISFNTAENIMDPSKIVYASVIRDFTDYLFPERLRTPDPVPDEELTGYSGEYELNRYPHSTIAKISKLAMVMKVYPKEGYLATELGGNYDLWSPIGNNAFRSLESSEVIAFEEVDGKFQHMFIGGYPIFAFDRLSVIETPGFHAMVFSLTLLIMIITLIYWPLAYMVRRGYREERPTKLPLAAKFLAWFNIFFYILFFILIGIGFANPVDLVYGVPKVVEVALAVPILNIVLLLLMGFMMAWIWRENYSKRWNRVYYFILVLTFTVAIWQLNYWNLLGWNY
jgi:CubicO group peptidase (beta-lactamase class C family)